MLDVFLSAVLPIFALMALGLVLGRMAVFDQVMALAINRFVFLVSIPALIFGLLSRSPIEQFNWLALAAFAAIELAMYVAGFLVARYGFRREIREALLVGLATAFANHLLFILPIATTLFGEGSAIPIVAIASVDALFIYGGTLLLMDALSETDGSITRVLFAFSRNPQILAIIGGVAIGISDFELAEGLQVFTNFAGSTAAPCSLFALGVILSRRGGDEALMLPLAISGLKLIVFPLFCWGLIVGLLDVEWTWAKPTTMVAAAPSSAMAFVLAVNYRVSAAAIARTILMTMIGSLLTITYVSSL